MNTFFRCFSSPHADNANFIICICSKAYLNINDFNKLEIQYV